jgi:hypothetical protein
MTAFLDMEFAPLVAAAATLSLLAVLFCRTSAARKRRILQLKTANELLKAHRDLLEAILDDPRVPERIKSRMLSFSDVISEKEMFLEIFEEVCADLRSGGRQDERSIDADVAALNAIEDGLGHKLTTSVSTGVAAMLLQYAHVTETAMAKMYADRRTETSLFASAVRRSRDIRQHEAAVMPAGMIGAT